MKKFSLLIITAIMAAATVSAQSPDTVTVIEQPSQVIITETPTGSHVKVIGSKEKEDYSYTYTMQHASNDTVHTTSDWELNFPFKKNKRKRYHWTMETKGLYFGGGLKTSCDLVNNSFNWGILDIASINYDTWHGQHFSLGVGYDNKRFSLKRPNCFVMDEATGIVGTSTYPDDVKDRSSVLSIRAIQFPLLFQQDLGEDFHIVLGASMNWNVYAKCNTHYKVNKTHHDVSYRGVKQNKLTFDVIGAFSFDGLAIYGRYSPCNMFKKGYGPEIKNTWTLGVAIAL
ncbi:MAG: hypothetical protein IJJ83_01275 [Muribaculaceae bacterium]|jgi:hypothetical protein|nr:hypothetical protein [Bacteroidales bacterium]MBR0492369.1 hypothetical protein [Muribaculaceae bacterium]